jgi:hypothetical protein
LGDFSFSVSGSTGLIGHYHPCCILQFQFQSQQHDPTPLQTSLLYFSKSAAVGTVRAGKKCWHGSCFKKEKDFFKKFLLFLTRCIDFPT